MQSGISYAGDKLGKKAAAKSGDFVMKKRARKFNKPSMGTKPFTPSIAPREESTDMAINRLISGSEIKRMTRKIV